MATEPRLRLYQYENSPYCIPIRDDAGSTSSVPYEIKTLPAYDPTEVIRLTGANYYYVPIVEDILANEVIWEKPGVGVAQYVDTLTQSNLFPEEDFGAKESGRLPVHRDLLRGRVIPRLRRVLRQMGQERDGAAVYCDDTKSASSARVASRTGSGTWTNGRMNCSCD